MDAESRNRWNATQLADMAMHLSNQLAEDMETLREIRSRWGDGGRCQVEDLEDRFRMNPISDQGHEIYIALSGIATRQDSVVTEVGQAMDAADVLLGKLRRVSMLVSR